MDKCSRYPAALIVLLATAGSGSPFGAAAAATPPNDPLFPNQVNLTGEPLGIRVLPAWNRSMGAGVVVAVIDSGILPHPDMDANVIPGYDFISDASVSGDSDGRDPDPFDAMAASSTSCGYYFSGGLGMASLVAAVTNNAIGMAGIAPDARIMPVRAIPGRCGASVGDIADAIVWSSGGSVPGVPDNATPAEVIVWSRGQNDNLDEACDPALQAAIDVAVANGSVVVMPNAYAPGQCTGAILVDGFDQDGNHSWRFRGSERVDLMAPMNSVFLSQGGHANGGRYEFPAAHVAGTAALMQATRPNSPARVEAILKGTTRPLPDDCADVCGEGQLTASAALVATTTPMVFALAESRTILEGSGGTHFVRVDVHLSIPSSTPVTFDFATHGATATPGGDFGEIALTGQAFAPGEVLKTFYVPVTADAQTEGDERFFVDIANVAGAMAGKSRTTITIVDDDALPLANGVAVTGVSLSDGAAKLYSIFVPYGSSRLTFDMSVATGKGAIWVKRGSPPKFEDDADCTALWHIGTCQFNAPQGGTYFVRFAGAPMFRQGTLKASFKEPPVMSIEPVSIIEANAGTKALTFTVRLSYSSWVPIYVALRTVAGTATAGSDFTPRSATLVIPAGQVGALFSVTTFGDTTLEPSESFSVVVDSVVGATGAPDQVAGTIVDNEGPMLSINDVAVAEGASGTRQMSFTVRLDEATNVPVSYGLRTRDAEATAGSDYDAVSLDGQVIPAGQLARVHTVTLHGDTQAEATERLMLELVQPVGAALVRQHGIGYILDDDGPALSVLDVSVVEGGPHWRDLRVPVRLSKPATVPVTFQLRAIGGTAFGTISGNGDYALYNDTVSGTFAPGEVSKSFYFASVTGDYRAEANETIELRLENASGASTYDWLGTATIVNDDGPTLSVQNTGITEGNAGTKVATFMVTLSQAAGVPVSYSITTGDGTASAGSDYVARSLAGETIPAGMLSRTFAVTINGDVAVEGTETFNATITNASGATIFRPRATGTITDND